MTLVTSSGWTGGRRLMLGALSLLLVAGIDATGMAGRSVHGATPSKPGPCVAGWQEMPVPDSALASTPYEVLTQSGKPKWAIGGRKSGPLVLRWNNGKWRLVRGGGSGHKGFVGGVPTSKSTVLGVGYSRPSDFRLVPISARISSTRVVKRFVPDPPGPRAALADVAKVKSGRTWAVGTRLIGGRTRGYALRHNGRRWVRDDPSGTGKSSGLTAVEVAPDGVPWTVGWKEKNAGQPSPLIARRAGGEWKLMSGPALPNGAAALTDIAFRKSSDGWAVGYLLEAGSSAYRVLLLHWDGGSWKREPLPWSDDFPAVPRAVATGAAGELWIAGTQLATNNREARGFIASLAEGTWSLARLDVPKNVRSEVLSVKSTRKGAIASGTVENSALLLRACSVGNTAAGTTGRLVSISALAARKAAVGTAHGDADERSLPDEAATEATSTGEISTSAARPAALPVAVAASGFRVRDVAKQKGLGFDTATWGGFATDMDGDGRKDVFISRHKKHRPFLMLNRNGKFKRAGSGKFALVDRHDCDAADIDQDGARDILCVVGRGRGRQINRHELSLRPGHPNGQLLRGTKGISDPFGRGRRVAFMRLDDDPFPEVFVANQPDRDDSQRGTNRFYRNVKGKFASAPGVGLDRPVGADCLVAGDMDEDGDHDLLQCVVYPDDGRPPGLRIYRNENGRLRERSAGLGVKPMRDIDVVLKDVTGDGREDLIQLSPTRLRVSKGTKAGFTKIYEARTSNAIAIAAGDASGDGRPDIYLLRGGQGNKPDQLLVNRSGGRRWVSVRIPQTSKGRADDVFALDHDKNGHADFVVLNGFNRVGPVQLLASYPTN